MVQTIGFGTAAIGRPQYINIRKQKALAFDHESFVKSGIQVLDEAYRQGVRYFDTAPGYGLAEQLLIDWVTKKDDPEIEVATKWGYTYTANFDPNATIHEVKDHSIDQLNRQWKKSEQLLPYVTTLQIHSATLDTGVLENEAVLERLSEIKTNQNIRIGLTTSGHNQNEVIRKALEIESNGVLLFDVFQMTYNILDQSILSVINELKTLKNRIVIKEAMANGRVFRNERFPHYAAMYDLLESIAIKYDVEVDAIALRFCMDSIFPFKVLSGAATSDQLAQNFQANNFVLSEEEINNLKSFRCDPREYWSERKQLPWN